MLDLVLTNRTKLVENVVFQGSCGHEMLEFEIRGAVRKAFTKLAALAFRRVYFGLLRGLAGGVLWDRDLEGRGAQECSLMFKDHLFQIQELYIPTRKKSGKHYRPAQIKNELLQKIRGET